MTFGLYGKIDYNKIKSLQWISDNNIYLMTDSLQFIKDMQIKFINIKFNMVDIYILNKIKVDKDNLFNVNVLSILEEHGLLINDTNFDVMKHPIKTIKIDENIKIPFKTVNYYIPMVFHKPELFESYVKKILGEYYNKSGLRTKSIMMRKVNDKMIKPIQPMISNVKNHYYFLLNILTKLPFEKFPSKLNNVTDMKKLEFLQERYDSPVCFFKKNAFQTLTYPCPVLKVKRKPKPKEKEKPKDAIYYFNKIYDWSLKNKEKSAGIIIFFFILFIITRMM